MFVQKTPKTKRNFYPTNPDLLVSFGVVLLCLLSSLLFPAKNSAQTITKSLFFLVLLPIAYIKIILQKNLSDFGWNLKNKALALRWGAGTALFTLIIFYLMLNYTQFKTGYVLEDYIKHNFWLFLAQELVINNFNLFIFSCFFQGFVFFLFADKLKAWTIAVPAGLFFAILLFTKTFSWQIAPFILLSLVGGFLTYKTKSFFYSYFMSFFAIIILDAYIIYLTK
jgi:hypothetical protein